MTTTAAESTWSATRAVVVLTNHWESRSEPGWIVRQVAGALACEADVHVVTPDPSGPGQTTVDSVFTVHRIDPSAPGGPGADDVSQLALDAAVVAVRHWSEMGRLNELADRCDIDPDVPRIVLMLAGGFDDNIPEPLLGSIDRLQALLVVTEEGKAELSKVVAPERIHCIGAPLDANPTVLSEPDPLVGEADYVLVHSGVNEHAAHPSAELSQLLRVRFPARVIALLHDDAFCVWRNGRVVRTDPVERSSDVARLMAWARATVDLRPGPLFARRCLESLLYGSPIVVPRDSRAKDHAERGRSGLWFANAAELTWCVEAVLDHSIREALSSQGLAYARDAFGSTDRFIDRVSNACAHTSSS